MLNFYYRSVKLLINGKEVLKNSLKYNYSYGLDNLLVLLEKPPGNEEIKISWENLETAVPKKFLYAHDIKVHHHRKGRTLIYYPSDKFFGKIIKENKEELSMTMVYQYRKAEISLKEILEYHDGEKVIKYLQERGLKNYEQNKFKTI